MKRGRWPADRAAILDGRGRIPDLPFDAVRPIQDAVRTGGDAAIRELSVRFDGFAPKQLEIPRKELQDAWKRLDPKLKAGLTACRDAIAAFHTAQMPKPMQWTSPAGVRLGRRNLPVASAGAYIPGGRASYPSTALMCIVPAKVAGVASVVACTPPGPTGKPADITLAALYLAGADRVFAVGGAQAIFAMAHGTETVPAVERIVGPGNAYVAAAKALVAGVAPIDAPAGPSEILVLADATADVGMVAGELVAQAEHDPQAWCAVASSNSAFLAAVAAEVERQAASTPRKEIVQKALANGWLIQCPAGSLAALADATAAEHLSLQVKAPRALFNKIHNYGSAFLGPHSRVAFGDYISGSNHVLPTAGLARSWGGLDVETFLRRATHQEVSRKALPALRKALPVAEAEGLFAHAATMRGAP
ncbi:MAG: histidinol dehydrogenase [Candidatus Thermoplasmatota archaeon]